MGLFNPQSVNGVNTNFMRLGSENQIDLASKINSLFNEPLRREAAQQALFGNQLQNTIQAEAFRQSLENYPIQQRLAQLNLQDAERKAKLQPQLDDLNLRMLQLAEQEYKNSKDKTAQVVKDLTTVNDRNSNPTVSISPTPQNSDLTDEVSPTQFNPYEIRQAGISQADMAYKNLSPEVIRSLQTVSKEAGFEDLVNLLSLKVMESGATNDFSFGRHGDASTARGLFGLTKGYRDDFFENGKGKLIYEKFKNNNPEAYAQALKAFGGTDEAMKDIFAIAAAQQDGNYLMGEPNSAKSKFSNIYFGHFLGAKGGRDFLAGYYDLGTDEKRSKTPISKLVSKQAIEANPDVFKDKEGKLLSVQQFYNKMASKADGVQEGIMKALGIEFNSSLYSPTAGTDNASMIKKIVQTENNIKIANLANASNSERVLMPKADQDMGRLYASQIKETADLFGKNEKGELDMVSNVASLVGLSPTFMKQANLQNISAFQTFIQSKTKEELDENYEKLWKDEAIGKALGNADQGILLNLYTGMKTYFDMNMNDMKAFTMTSFDKDNIRVFSKPALEKFNAEYIKNMNAYSANNRNKMFNRKVFNDVNSLFNGIPGFIGDDNPDHHYIDTGDTIMMYDFSPTD